MTAPSPLTAALGFYPTPLHPLDRLSAAFGDRARVWIKRDDQTGLATGGNKVRKLEFLVADALRSGATVLVTSGARQSNHCRQTAAAAARLGLRCVLVLTPGALDTTDYRASGNVLLDQLVGAELVEVEPDEDPATATAELLQRLNDSGERPYLIPVGGSSALGSLGYARCIDEILESPNTFTSIVLPTGSGGTQAGLLAGLNQHQRALPVIGVSVGAPAAEQREKVHTIANQAARLLSPSPDEPIPLSDVIVDDRHIGPGYGRPTPSMIEAVQLLARTEGILLDPVYTGKAMAGLIQQLQTPDLSIGDNVLFLHTGGQAGLYAYRAALTDY